MAICPSGARTPLTTPANGLRVLALIHLQPSRSWSGTSYLVTATENNKLSRATVNWGWLLPQERVRPCIFLHRLPANHTIQLPSLLQLRNIVPCGRFVQATLPALCATTKSSRAPSPIVMSRARMHEWSHIARDRSDLPVQSKDTHYRPASHNGMIFSQLPLS
ncbi:hypothetical protein BU25DRAFT_62733 [Macroventuria anomochaeta]|uniref:Uncharacterized protein n=1 Tax=Macroventuria anomochaeta TaxID=301207 RepID=A0ACB6S1X7_9PLEO|nr:uncharacterized protein BU25DRAFT_62733 [Macroventuria anomochaeta]KAF2627389.1 hypothetical protein BU25DRAFT_62733 [Macroventuria anomochaeta]